jgi:hypothetical protein
MRNWNVELQWLQDPSEISVKSADISGIKRELMSLQGRVRTSETCIEK